jgi:hypothetical protein
MIEEKTLKIEKPYWLVRRFAEYITMIEVDTPEELNEQWENIVVEAGEIGHLSNIELTSHS